MSVRIIIGDALTELRKLPDESVHCCVTSPPYFGLRDYGCDGQIGLEPSPDEYVAALVAVFREVRRVLRNDGTLWLNIGDSYASNWPCNRRNQIGSGSLPNGKREARPPRGIGGGVKDKDLIGIPWLLAFALRNDGWWLRSDIIWSKPNPMPESITDRPTKAHEYLFLLAESQRYYYDAEAIAEGSNSFGRQHTSGEQSPKTKALKAAGFHGEGGDLGLNYERETRNKRSVWTVATAPYSEAHFATFPPALIEPCILAGTSEKGVCAECGAPWVRATERIDKGFDGSKYGERVVAASGGAKSGGTARSTLGSGNGRLTGGSETIGWSPSCACDAAIVPGTVLDPFGGAGTTGLVADRLGRSAILIELNPQYAEMARRRIHNDAPLFAKVGHFTAAIGSGL